MMNATIRKFLYPQTLVREYDSWVVLLRPQQVTLGSLVLACKDDATRFSQIPRAAFLELPDAIADVETALLDAFGYEKINYLMLMMVDPEVHFHVFPRYDTSRTFEGREFPDHGWPGPPALDRITDTDASTNASIIAALKERLPTR